MGDNLGISERKLPRDGIARETSECCHNVSRCLVAWIELSLCHRHTGSARPFSLWRSRSKRHKLEFLEKQIFLSQALPPPHDLVRQSVTNGIVTRVGSHPARLSVPLTQLLSPGADVGGGGGTCSNPPCAAILNAGSPTDTLMISRKREPRTHKVVHLPMPNQDLCPAPPV